MAEVPGEQFFREIKTNFFFFFGNRDGEGYIKEEGEGKGP